MRTRRRLTVGLVMLVVCLGSSERWAVAEQAGRPTTQGERLRDRDLEYARGDGKPLLLDVYLPEKTEGRLPVIIWVHGGGWRGGSKENCEAIRLTGHGYAVVSINYRLSKEAPFPAQIEDCKAAVRWVRANADKYGWDPDRIGAWGASAGGHLVALLGTTGGMKELEGKGGNEAYSSRVQAVCDFYGPTDLLKVKLQSSQPEGERRDMVLELLLGGPLEENKDKAKLASPINHVSKDDPPMLIVHGDQDRAVPLEHSQLLYEAMTRAKLDATLHVVKGGGHGRGFNPREIDPLVQAFFDKHLKGGVTPAGKDRPPGQTP